MREERGSSLPDYTSLGLLDSGNSLLAMLMLASATGWALFQILKFYTSEENQGKTGGGGGGGGGQSIVGPISNIMPDDDIDLL